MTNPERGLETQSRTPDRIPRVIILGCVLCWAGWLAHQPAYDPHSDKAAGRTVLSSKVNLNTDPWWKLAALPNIGMIKAKRIVEYRETCCNERAFTKANDLELVRGIGPKTVADMRPLVVCEMKGPPPASR